MSRKLLNSLREVVLENSEKMYIASSKLFIQKTAELEFDQFYSPVLLEEEKGQIKHVKKFYGSPAEKEAQMKRVQTA